MLDGSVDILLNTLAIENMPASGLNRVFGDIVAQPAHRRLGKFLSRELTRILFALQNEIRLKERVRGINTF